VKAFKILSDKLTKEVGFIVSASFRDPDEMPDALSDAQIRSRFGMSHYIQLLNFGEDEAREFINSLLDEWVDPARRSAILGAHGAEAEGEAVGGATFPFTEPALGRFVELACRNGGVTNPRDVQHTLDDVLNRAIDDERHVLSGSYMDRLLAAG
jgi:hypothetical protein